MNTTFHRTVGATDIPSSPNRLGHLIQIGLAVSGAVALTFGDPAFASAAKQPVQSAAPAPSRIKAMAATTATDIPPTLVGPGILAGGVTLNNSAPAGADGANGSKTGISGHGNGHDAPPVTSPAGWNVQVLSGTQLQGSGGDSLIVSSNGARGGNGG